MHSTTQTPIAAHPEHVDVCVVGAGPTGLSAATRLRKLGVDRVLVVEREEVAGGIPRHSFHMGYGLGDVHRLMTGPTYARHLVARAVRQGVDLRAETSALDWSEEGDLILGAPAGLTRVKARAVLLATGCRESPRAARLVPGTRPAGVFTTGQLQQWVYLKHWPVGNRAVIVGAEHVSFSALLTLRRAGVKSAAMVTEHPRDQTYAPLRWITAAAQGVPVLTRRSVVTVTGRTRVESLVTRDMVTGEVLDLPCDTLVFTGDFVAESELARRGGLALSAGSRAPAIDGSQRTSRRGVFAAGNAVHPAETASAAALCGDFAARTIWTYLSDGVWPEDDPIPLILDPPIAWVSPATVRSGASHIPHGHYLLRVSTLTEKVGLEISQAGIALWSAGLGTVTPGRSVHLDAGWAKVVRPDGGPVSLRLRPLG